MSDASEGTITQTLQRGLEVLSAFRADRKALSNTELVRRTGLSKATVSRLTTTLVQLGYLRRAASGGGFELGSRGLGVGHTFVQSSPILGVAMPLMQRVADKLNVSVALAMAEDLHMVYLAYTPAKRIATLRLGIGSFLPMGLTAVGRAYLYSLAPVGREQKLQRLKLTSPAQAEAIERGARSAFDDLDKTHTCTCVGEFQRDAVGIATPVFVGRSGTPMSLSCGAVGLAPKLEAAKDRIVPELLSLCHLMQAALAEQECGASPAPRTLAVNLPP